jgi:hypothetical protein
VDGLRKENKKQQQWYQGVATNLGIISDQDEEKKGGKSGCDKSNGDAAADHQRPQEGERQDFQEEGDSHSCCKASLSSTSDPKP